MKRQWLLTVCAVTAAAGGIWLIGVSFRTDTANEQVASRVLSLGGQIENVDSSNSLGGVAVILDFTQVSNADLGMIASMDNVRRLSLMGTEIDDRGLARLSTLTQLTELS